MIPSNALDMQQAFGMPLKTLLLLNVGSTLFLTGLIWTIQVVHYPLFAGVGAEQFLAYHARHNTLITLVVMPVMLFEIGTAGLLALGARPEGLPAWAAWAGFGLVLGVWASTFFLQVPMHNALFSGFDAGAHRFLVQSNWLRTALWSLKSALGLWMLALFMR